MIDPSLERRGEGNSNNVACLRSLVKSVDDDGTFHLFMAHFGRFLFCPKRNYLTQSHIFYSSRIFRMTQVQCISSFLATYIFPSSSARSKWASKKEDCEISSETSHARFFSHLSLPQRSCHSSTDRKRVVRSPCFIFSLPLRSFGLPRRWSVV